MKNQIEEVNNVYMTMRGWRHDYHNHMQSLKAYLAMDDISEARAYLDKLETDLDDINLLFNFTFDLSPALLHDFTPLQP